MNILYIYSSNINPTRGGVQRVTKVLCDAFRKEGHTCYYLSSQSSNEDIEHQYVLPSSNTFDPDNIAFIQSFIKEKSIDIVVNQDGLNKVMTRLVHKSCYGRVKIFTVAHNSLIAPCANFTTVRYPFFKNLHLSWLLPLFNLGIVKAIVNILYRIKYKRHYQDIMVYSNKFILLSNAFKKELEFFLSDYPEDKVCAIFNPCTVERDDNEQIEKKKVVLYVGRISFGQKRNDLLLRIWSQIEPMHPDWVLKIVGDGEDLPALKQMANDMNLRNVSFEGYQPPEQYYREASIFCMTSAYEGFGLVLTEAMAYGCVPIAFNSFCSAVDVIDDGVNGLLVEAFDIDEYSRRLNKLMSDSLYIGSFYNKTIEKSKKFGINKISTKWLELFSE